MASLLTEPRVVRRRQETRADLQAPQAEEGRLVLEPTLWLRLRWLALAFAPSSLLLGVTMFISTDIASFPLLWIIPLALYLLTFVLVFSRTSFPYRAFKWSQCRFNRVLDAELPKWLARGLDRLIGRYGEAFNPDKPVAQADAPSPTRDPGDRVLLYGQPYVDADDGRAGAGDVLRHGHGVPRRVARSRPKARYLTEFYIWMSVGGVLGGMFNTLVAPLIFETVLEYSLVIAVACMLRPRFFRPRWPVIARWLDLLIPAALFLVMYVLMAFNQHGEDATRYPWVGQFNQGMKRAVGFDLGGMVKWVPKLSARLDVAFPRGQKPAEEDEEGDEVDAPQTVEKKWDLNEAACILLLGGVVAFACQFRPLRFGSAVLVVLLAQQLWYGPDAEGREFVKDDVKTVDRIVYRTRSFFGVMRVREFGRVRVSRDAEGRETEEVLYHSHTLRHGTTDHGEQRFDHGWRREPISYYFRRNSLCDVGNSPLANVFEKLIDPRQHREIGVCGLGTGTTAAFGQPGQRITYFEIDPAVVEIAMKPMVEDPLTKERIPLFTFVGDSKATVDIKLGDARLTLQREPDEKYDLLIVDAFSSDAIPVHLLTKEAVELYFRKLKPDGILVVHISNRHLELAPVVGNIARDSTRPPCNVGTGQTAAWTSAAPTGSLWPATRGARPAAGPVAGRGAPDPVGARSALPGGDRLARRFFRRRQRASVAARAGHYPGEIRAEVRPTSPRMNRHLDHLRRMGQQGGRHGLGQLVGLGDPPRRHTERPGQAHVVDRRVHHVQAEESDFSRKMSLKNLLL